MTPGRFLCFQSRPVGGGEAIRDNSQAPGSWPRPQSRLHSLAPPQECAKGEILSRKWTDIDLHSKIPDLRADHKKSSTEKDPTPRHCRRCRVAETAGIKQLRFHDLRHFTASTLTSAGVADNIISLLTGHKSRKLRRYQHLREDLKRGTVDLIAKTLEEAQRNSKGRNGASSAHLLHTGSKVGKKRTGKDSK